jgi:Zn-dependent protease with chaperone function
VATNFFEHQDVARRNTTRLIVLFGLAVLAIIASIEVLLAATMGYLGRHPDTGAVDWSVVTNPQLLLVAVGGTLLVVGGGSLFKIAQLRAGGGVVAEQLGGRLLNVGTSDLVEQRVLNIVEEMAIASGTPTPPVYLMDKEEGINAFAAGFSPADAVIGITRGAATRLDRDELQGVIAHEFSHILNGDMRMNIRLMGLLHGILIIGMMGYFVLRMSFYSGHAFGGRRSRDNNSGIPILAIGLGLTVIGFAGTFFGNLIKAAVSRQREYLADASAVQFTRDPGGLSGALKKIGGFAKGSGIQNPNAPEASHMFFGRATSGLSALFSTHPPIDTRIRRIDPAWDGEFPDAVPPTDTTDRVQAAGAAGFAGGGAAPAQSPAAALEHAVESIGHPTPEHLQYAANLLARLPREVVTAAREPYGARAVVYALLLDAAPAIRAPQLSHLDDAADRGVADTTRRLAPAIDGLDARMRLPLLEITLPALRALTPTQRQVFEQNVIALAEADHSIDLFEWALYRIMKRELAEGRNGHSPRIVHRSLAAVQPEIQLLLSALAHVGQRQPGEAGPAFEAGRRTLGLKGLQLTPVEHCGLAELDHALARLDEASLEVKRSILDAGVACLSADQQVTAQEAELLRAVSASLGCPMPPLLI